MRKVPDAASVATILWLEKLIGRKAGASTGTNLWGALLVANEMMRDGQKGSIVSLMCDSGERYMDTYYDPDWVRKSIGDVSEFEIELSSWL
jgi:cysteine synthase A